MSERAVVLLSGGMDSAVVLAVARAEGFAVYALTFRYGQRHVVEVEAAYRVAAAGGAVEHRVAVVDLRPFGGSALTGDLDVPHHAAGQGGIPVTYVPARNTIFLSYALAWAETLGAQEIFIGVNAQDRGGYPDCRPEYIAAFERMAGLATAAGVAGRAVRVRAPLADLAKTQIVELGAGLGVDFSLTHSCYDPAGDRPCGSCDACLLRAGAFAELGVADGAL